MHPTLPALIELQKLDLLIRHDEQEMARLPLELSALQKREEEKKAELHSLEQQLQSTELMRRKLELEEKGHRDRIAKLRAQQMQTRKNDEYQALEIEISSAMEAVLNTEERYLALLELIEQQKEQLSQAHERFSQVREKIAMQAEEARSKAAAASTRLEKNRASAQQARSKVDADLLKKYDSLRAGGKHNAVVPLSHGTVCSGCHMSVVHQTALDARSTDKVAVCENCGRILYDPEYEAAFI